MQEPTAHKIQVQGHRGERGNLPENTIPAFLSALEKGVDVFAIAGRRGSSIRTTGMSARSARRPELTFPSFLAGFGIKAKDVKTFLIMAAGRGDNDIAVNDDRTRRSTPG